MMKRGGYMSSTSCSSGVVFLVLFSGCATASLPKIKTYEEASREVDAKGKLVSPPVEQREGYEEGKSEPIQKDQAANYSGILMDEKKATKLVAIKAERDRRLAELEAVTRKVEIQRIIYESAVEHLKAKLDARASWWERNKLWVGFSAGTVLGMAIVTSLTYALTRGKGLATGSTAQPIFSLP